MKLDIDTSDSEKIVVRIGDEKFEEDARKEKSQKLLPFIDKLLRQKKIKLQDFSEINVDTGPGSYTGLRVGVSVAITLGWVLGVPVNKKNILNGDKIEINYD